MASGYLADIDKDFGVNEESNKTEFTEGELQQSNNLAINREETVYKDKIDDNYDDNLEKVDKAIDKTLDYVEPGLGARLKSIKEIGNVTVDLAKNEIKNAFDCETDCEAKGEKLFDDWQNDVKKSFLNAVAPMRNISEIADKTKGAVDYGVSKFNDLLNRLL